MSAKYRLPRIDLRLLIAAVGVAAAMSSAPAWACNPQMVTAPEAVRIPYNPFVAATASQQIRLELKNASDSACELRLVFRDIGGVRLPRVEPGGVAVEFRELGLDGLVARDADPGVFDLPVPADGKVTPTFDLLIVRDALPEAGDHPVDLMMDITAPDGTPYLSLIPVRITLVAEPRAQVNIAGSAGAYGSGSSVDVIDFGDAETAATRQAFLQVRANAVATVTFASENKGQMRHVEFGEKSSPVPYTLDVDGQPIDLTDEATLKVNPPRTFEGVSLLMVFTLGEIGSQMSGKYTDLITIDITPK